MVRGNELLTSRILLVDDEELNLRLLEQLLASAGYRHLRLVSDSRQVEEVFNSFQPDLVALDLHMPHIDGFELLERLRGLVPTGVFLPVVVLTADATTATRRRALSLGATDFLTKPIDVVEVILRVGRLLETRDLHLALADERTGLVAAVEERTVELAVANRRLQDLIRTKDEFVASVSHELRTPLTVVVGFARELADHTDLFDRGETQAIAQLVAEHSSEVAAIIDDLLVAARVEIGAVGVLSETVDVAAELEAALSALPRDAARTVRRPAGTAVVRADRLRVRQILRNLLANAFRHGGTSVAVEVTPNGAIVNVAVLDDGTGVPAADRERLFEPYFRGSKPLGQTASIGLGLTVSRRLALLMGGDLVYRPAEIGSVFELTLPNAS